MQCYDILSPEYISRHIQDRGEVFSHFILFIATAYRASLSEGIYHIDRVHRVIRDMANDVVALIMSANSDTPRKNE